MLISIPYLGKQGTRGKKNLTRSYYFTRKLTKPYQENHRNVITDHWLTSVPLMFEFLNNCDMFQLGTVRGNKKKIPQEIKEKTARNWRSTGFLCTNEMTLVPYMSNTFKNQRSWCGFCRFKTLSYTPLEY